MLALLQLKNVGPAPELTMQMGPRLNLITGDNGLGKTLLLDTAWWALTRTWPLTWSGKGVVPSVEPAEIVWEERRGASTLRSHGFYDFGEATWRRHEDGEASVADDKPQASRLTGPVVVYLRVDGGISVHDPLRAGEAFRLPFGQTARGKSHVYQFRDADIWDGLALPPDDKLVCEGLVRDVGRWATQPDNAEFDQLAAIVEQLACSEPFRLTREVGRVYVDDTRDSPMLKGPGGQLPVVHAPAGLRRILGLAYLVVWTWREHRIAASLKKRAPNRSLVVLIDELESHLHPKWQRTLLPSLLGALSHDVSLQLVATTHSPMVLASAEPVFDVATDKLFRLDLENEAAVLHEQAWAKQGDVLNWLVSDTFGLRQARSVEAERAIEAAQAWMRGETQALPPSLATKEAIHAELQRVLPGHDPFWPRWVISYETAGGAT